MFLLRIISCVLLTTGLFVACNGGPPGPADQYRGQWAIMSVTILGADADGNDITIHTDESDEQVYSRTSMWLTKSNEVRSEIYYRVDEYGQDPIIYTEQLRNGLYSVSDNTLRIDWEDATFDECVLDEGGRSFTRTELNPFDNRTWVFHYQKISE